MKHIQSGIITEERRKFLKKAGELTAMAIIGGTILQSCGADDDIEPTGASGDLNSGSGIVVSGNVTQINLDIQTVLKGSGGWILINDSKMLVINDGGTYKALTSICTHTACTDQWGRSGSDFICNCHGSKFSNDGVVTAGPANRNLTKFTTSVSSNVLTVTK